MINIEKRDIKTLAFVTAGASLLTMAIREIFRAFRKVPSVDRSFFHPDSNGVSKLAASGTAPAIAPVPEPASESALNSGELTKNTSPIELSEDSAHVTMLLSEAVLRKDWDSPEDNEAWANL